ncbi:hypothetical protein M426DRAFT_128895 [Hypoxylon sp. CI-4A]|nr:hypothetical protein M426DRAFT_128895 [Hypoxylon sp. CI-4A]
MSTDTHIVQQKDTAHPTNDNGLVFPFVFSEFSKRLTSTRQDFTEPFQDWPQIIQAASDNHDKPQHIKIITDAIDHTRLAFEALLKDSTDAQRRYWFSELSDMVFTRYKILREAPDLDASIDYLRSSLDSDEDVSEPAVTWRMERLGNHLFTRYHKDQSKRDLDDSIDIGMRLVEKTPGDDNHYKKRVDHVLLRLLIRRREEWTMQDVRLSIPLAREMHIHSTTNAAKLEYALTLAELLGEASQHSHQNDGLGEAIGIYEEVLANSCYELRVWKRAGVLSDLAACYALRHRNKRCEEDVDKGIERMENALKLVHRGDESGTRPRMLNNYADLLWDKYDITGSIVLLDESVKNCQTAVYLSKLTDLNAVMY